MPEHLTLYHGGILQELPKVAHIDFSTDRELAETRAAAWGPHGHVLEVTIEVGPHNRPVDRHWRYLANMPMIRPGHKQFSYSAGRIADQIKAKRAAVAATGQPWEVGQAMPIMNEPS